MKNPAKQISEAIVFCFPRLEAAVLDDNTVRIGFEGRTADIDVAAAMQGRAAFKEAMRVATESVGWKP